MPGVRSAALLVWLAGPAGLIGHPAEAEARPAFSAATAVEIAGGHDSNLLLTPAPSGSPRLGGGFAAVSPTLVLGVSSADMRFDARYVGDLRFADSEVGRLFLHEAGLSLALPDVGPLSLELSAFGGLFDASRFADERIIYTGGDLAARLELGTSLRLLGQYRLAARAIGAAYADAARDLVHLGTLRLPWRPTSRIEVAPLVALVAVTPLETGAADSLQRLRGGFEGSLVWNRLTASLGAGAGPVWVAGGPAELDLGVRTEVRVRLWQWLDVFASYEASGPWGASDLESLQRQQAMGGLTAYLTTRPGLPAPAAAHADEQVQLRPVLEGGKARFRVEAPAASRVELVGSWDDWATPGRALARTNGVWELWFELPAGAHRYHFLVDGAAVRPPDAPRYVQDGFGGEDGVIDVP